MSKYHVLVTGCAGYLGSVLCQELLYHGFKVFGIDSLAYGNAGALCHVLGHPNFTFGRCDACDVEVYRDYVRAADAVIPLAAVVGASACEKDPRGARETNQYAIHSLLRAVSPQQRVVFPNTNSGYGAADGEVDEDSPMNPLSLYADTKVQAERMVLDHPRGVSLRLATVFGVSPRMRFDLLVNDFTMRLCTLGRLEVYEPGFKRNGVHVRDVARCFRWALQEGGVTGPLNVALPSANLTKLELARQVCRAVRLPEDRVVAGWGIDPDRRDCFVSSGRLRSAGFVFLHGLEDGVKAVATLVDQLGQHACLQMRNA